MLLATVAWLAAGCTPNQPLPDQTVDKPAQYLQASSAITQCPSMTPEVVRIDVTGAANGMTLTDGAVA